MRKAVATLLLAAALVGCSTMTTTTATIGYQHQPLVTNVSQGTLSGIKFGGNLVYSMDRNVSRFGACLGTGYDWTDKPSLNTGSTDVTTTTPSHGLAGTVCHVSDLP